MPAGRCAHLRFGWATRIATYAGASRYRGLRAFHAGGALCSPSVRVGNKDRDLRWSIEIPWPKSIPCRRGVVLTFGSGEQQGSRPTLERRDTVAPRAFHDGVTHSYAHLRR